MDGVPERLAELARRDQGLPRAGAPHPWLAGSCADAWKPRPSRFGSFEIFKPADERTGRAGPSVGRNDIRVQMLDYVVGTFYPEIQAAHAGDSVQRNAAFFREVGGPAPPGDAGSASLVHQQWAPRSSWGPSCARPAPAHLGCTLFLPILAGGEYLGQEMRPAPSSSLWQAGGRVSLPCGPACVHSRAERGPCRCPSALSCTGGMAQAGLAAGPWPGRVARLSPSPGSRAQPGPQQVCLSMRYLVWSSAGRRSREVKVPSFFLYG